MVAYLLLAGVLLFCVYVLVRWFIEADPKDVIKVLKWLAVALVLGLIVFLILSGRLGWALSALPLLFVWFGRVRQALFLGRLFRSFYKGKSQQQTSGQSKTARTTGAMSRQEALSILGLEEGAQKEEIKAAYHRLISQVHPDKGGSDYLASQINQAKETLLDD